MFCWTEDMVRFMRDSDGYGTYRAELLDWICAELVQAEHVCDAGCGLGFLALRLAERFPRVTAADLSEQALSNLRAMAAERRQENLEILQTDMFSYTPDEPFDAMVFCLFGRMEEILRIAKRCCSGRVVVIKKAFTHHRFSMSHVPLRDETTDPAAQMLRERGIPFSLEKREFEMGQPLRSFDDAMRFFAVYSRDEPGLLTRESVEKRLILTQDKEFPLYLPQKKQLGRFILDTKDIPEDI